ncbi:flagellar hook protein FlgE [Bacteriovoracaceae bacterium]|nr:flagellar hook protein FlgE [Bacteriovoracaceae bacterium]
MSILSSFNIGVSGLSAAGNSMSVVGDNIANSGTFGFKKSRAQFQDMLSKSLKGIDGGDQIGSGTKLAHVTPLFVQGSITRTDNITDLALNGNGFFAVKAPFGRGYTRDGSFHFDKEGNLVNSDEMPIMGFLADGDGKLTQKTGAIRLGNTTIPAMASTEVNFMMNLDSREEIMQFNPEDPDRTSSFNSSAVVYDNVGTERLLSVYFNKAADNTWEYHVMADGGDVNGGTAGKLVEQGNGRLVFNNLGQLQEEIPGANSFNFNKGAAPNQQILFNFGESISEGGNGRGLSSQFGSQSTVARTTSDGSNAATLASVSFNDEGVLLAMYDNGEVRNLAQVAIAKFENNEGLFKTGKNLFKETRKSGQASYGKPGIDGRGSILSKSIELSNVDIADEFINLMNAQRNFQANTRTITTADAMLQEILNIKR